MAPRSLRMLRFQSYQVPVEGSGWMLTLSDMLLLLLTFFVLLISMSTFDHGLLQETFGGLRPGTSGVLYRGETLPIVVDEKRTAQVRERRDLAYFRRLSPALSRLLDGLKQNLGPALRRVQVVGDSLELEIASDRLFGTLDDNLKPDGETIVRQLGRFLRGWSGPLEIELYTDNFPLRTQRIPDNQILAALRGERLVRALTKAGLPVSRVRLAAYGPDRALVVNDTPVHRYDNRRVIFRLPGWTEKFAGQS